MSRVYCSGLLLIPIPIPVCLNRVACTHELDVVDVLLLLLTRIRGVANQKPIKDSNPFCSAIQSGLRRWSPSEIKILLTIQSVTGV